MSAPVAGATLSGTVTFEATVTGGSIEAVVFTADDVPIPPSISQAPFTRDVDTSTLSDGSHVLAAMADGAVILMPM